MALVRTQLLSSLTPTPPHGTAAYVTAAFTPPQDSLLIASVACMANGGPFTMGRPTISGGGWSYTQRGFIAIDAAFSIQNTIYTAPVTTGASMTLTVDDPANRDIAGWLVQVIAYTGYDTVTPIAGETDSTTADIGDGAETQTLTATPVDADVSLYWLMGDVSTTTMAPSASGWTTVYDAGVTGGNGNLVTARRESSTSTSVAVTDVYTAGGTFFKAGMISLIVKDDGVPATGGVANSDYSKFPKQKLARV